MVNRSGINAPCTNDVVTLEEHIKSTNLEKGLRPTITFDYAINEKVAKNKIVKAAKRVPMEIEENSTSCNMIFSAGAWVHEVLPAVEYWEQVKGDLTCKIGDYEVKVGGIRTGKESNGKTVNTQVVFYGDRDKIVCHLYNTTQLILVNGHGYKKLVELFLKPYFVAKTTNNWEEIDSYNKDVIAKLSPKSVKRSNIKYKKASAFPCSSCDFASQSVSTLRKHKISEHVNKTNSCNSSNYLVEPRQSTRNNSVVIETLMLEDLSTNDITDTEEVSLEFRCHECSSVTNSQGELEVHMETKHSPELNEDVKFVCMQCEYHFESEGDYEDHIATHIQSYTDEEFKILVNSIYIDILEYHIEEMLHKSNDNEGQEVLED